MSERHGIEIDYCPRCRGVWLDRGELDKIIERSQWEGFAGDDGEGDGAQARRRDSAYRRHAKHKRRSWLSDLFED
jgi:Zn-finger nucleic acid-binding protein